MMRKNNIEAHDRFDEQIFQADIFVNNTSSTELGNIMQDVLAALSDHDFINYFTVSSSRAIAEYDRQLEEATEAPDHPHAEFPLGIIRCRPSSKQYCEDTTMDLYRLFT